MKNALSALPIKGCWHILKTGIRIHGTDDPDKVSLTSCCCALHNKLLHMVFRVFVGKMNTIMMVVIMALAEGGQRHSRCYCLPLES